MIGSCVNSHADHGRSDIFTAPGFAREILEREVLRHEADETRLDDSLAKRLIVRLRRDDECHAKNQRQQQPPETPQHRLTVILWPLSTICIAQRRRLVIVAQFDDGIRPRR